jgi:hypothetical protein
LQSQGPGYCLLLYVRPLSSAEGDAVLTDKADNLGGLIIRLGNWAEFSSRVGTFL